MIEVTFETAGLAAAAQKAGRVAPSKGVAFDKAAGVLIEGRPNEVDHKAITVKATNLEVDYLEWVRPLEIKSDGDFDWRIPSGLFSGFVGGLPIGSGKKVTFTQDEPGGPLTMKSGRTKARIGVITGLGFKNWEPYDSSAMQEVEGFSRRVNQVSWATDPQTVPFSGVHIDGEHIYATDRYKMVRVPCKVPLPEPVTVPLDTLAPILKTVEDVRLGVSERHLLLMPDEYTQLQTVIFDAEYPPIERAMHANFDVRVVLPRISFRDAVQRMLSLVGKGERYPKITLDIHDDVIDLFMAVDGVGEMTDTIEVEIDAEPEAADSTTIYFSPQYLTQALDNSRESSMTLQFLSSSPGRAASVTDGKGYDVWLMPRKATDPGEVKKEDDE